MPPGWWSAMSGYRVGSYLYLGGCLMFAADCLHQGAVKAQVLHQPAHEPGKHPAGTPAQKLVAAARNAPTFYSLGVALFTVGTCFFIIDAERQAAMP